MKINYDFKPYTREDAIYLAEALLDNLPKNSGEIVRDMKKQWNENGDRLMYLFHSYGYDIRGDILLNKNDLVITGKIPSKAWYMKRDIEKVIKEELSNTFK